VLHEAKGGVEATYPNGTQRFFAARPGCVAAWDQGLWLTTSAAANAFLGHGTAPRSGWLDYVTWYPLPLDARGVIVTLAVPSAPAAGPGDYWLYYLTSLQDVQRDAPLASLQSVVSYSRSGWAAATWTCCSSGQAHAGPTVWLDANDTAVHMAIYALPPAVGNDWAVLAVSGSRESRLVVSAADRAFGLAGVAFGAYHTSACDQMSPLALLANVAITRANGTTSSAPWRVADAAWRSGSARVAWRNRLS
jgi:hypothetical protein